MDSDSRSFLSGWDRRERRYFKRAPSSNIPAFYIDLSQQDHKKRLWTKLFESNSLWIKEQLGWEKNAFSFITKEIPVSAYVALFLFIIYISAGLIVPVVVPASIHVPASSSVSGVRHSSFSMAQDKCSNLKHKIYFGSFSFSLSHFRRNADSWINAKLSSAADHDR